MRLHHKHFVSAFLTFITLLTCISGTASAQSEFQVEQTDLQIYRDGLVRVTQTLSVNDTIPAVTVQLLASSADNFVVLDENQTVLDYSIAGTDLTLFTLGATNVSIQYDTHALTRKEFEVWTFTVDSPYNLTVQLPEQSTIVYLNELPASIDTIDNKITLSLLSGQWEVSYVFPLTPPAEFQVTDLKVSPSEVSPGDEVTVQVKVTNIGSQPGTYTLSLKINGITQETKTVTLEPAASTTIEFTVTKQTSGTYTIEVADLTAQFTVKDASTPGNPSSTSLPTELLIAVVAGAAAAIVFAIYFFKRRQPSAEKIFKTHPNLNTEERDVIRFLAENDGRAFESQIRERFPNIPRTSLWRLVRRLEKLEIVKVTKIGLENQVQLKR